MSNSSTNFVVKKQRTPITLNLIFGSLSVLCISSAFLVPDSAQAASVTYAPAYFKQEASSNLGKNVSWRTNLSLWMSNPAPRSGDIIDFQLFANVTNIREDWRSVYSPYTVFGYPMDGRWDDRTFKDSPLASLLYTRNADFHDVGSWKLESLDNVGATSYTYDGSACLDVKSASGCLNVKSNVPEQQRYIHLQNGPQSGDWNRLDVVNTINQNSEHGKFFGSGHWGLQGKIKVKRKNDWVQLFFTTAVLNSVTASWWLDPSNVANKYIAADSARLHTYAWAGSGRSLDGSLAETPISDTSDSTNGSSFADMSGGFTETQISDTSESISSVPEPETFPGLALFGVVLLAIKRYRSAKQSPKESKNTTDTINVEV